MSAASGSSSKIIFWLVCAIFCGGLLFSFYAAQQKSAAGGAGSKSFQKLDGAPRSTTPMGDYTKYYTRHEIKLGSGLFKHSLTYYLFAPRKPWPEKLRFPLVLILHGAPGNSYAGQYLITQQMQRDYPAFIVVPVLPSGQYWGMPSETSKDMQATARFRMPDVVTLLKTLMQQYPVDIDRIYTVGCSDGGTGVLSAIKYYSDIFAAAVPIGTAWMPAEAPYFTKVPIWYLHFALDSIFPAHIVRSFVRGVQANGGNIHYTEIPNMGHNCPYESLYTKPVWHWMFSQKKNK